MFQCLKQRAGSFLMHGVGCHFGCCREPLAIGSMIQSLTSVVTGTGGLFDSSTQPGRLSHFSLIQALWEIIFERNLLCFASATRAKIAPPHSASASLKDTSAELSLKHC